MHSIKVNRQGAKIPGEKIIKDPHFLGIKVIAEEEKYEPPVPRLFFL